MIERCHDDGTTRSVAQYSDCLTYRYALTRQWDAVAPRLAWVMLNPSTADERRNDPTIERCARRTRMLGFGGFRVVNLFAFRARDPTAVKRAPAPVGPDSDAALTRAAAWADVILCGWGCHGLHLQRGAAVEMLLRQTSRPLMHLGMTAGGAPRHPLYLPYARQPEPWLA